MACFIYLVLLLLLYIFLFTFFIYLFILFYFIFLSLFFFFFFFFLFPVAGQSSPKEEGIMEEELDTFATMPSVPACKAVHYTFPYVSQHFPEILSNAITFPRLHFSQPDILNNGEGELDYCYRLCCFMWEKCLW